MEKDKVFKVTIWFTNGESRVFGATKTYVSKEGIALKSIVNSSVIFFKSDRIAGVWDESEEWSDEWG